MQHFKTDSFLVALTETPLLLVRLTIGSSLPRTRTRAVPVSHTQKSPYATQIRPFLRCSLYAPIFRPGRDLFIEDLILPDLYVSSSIAQNRS